MPLSKPLATAFAAAALGLLAASPIARADFHHLCDSSITPSALTSLAVDGNEFVFSGTVKCGGAMEIHLGPPTITNDVTPRQFGESADCEDCSTLTASGRTAAVPGIYQVRFVFQVISGNGVPGYSRNRAGRWMWVTGAPTLLCGGRDAEPTNMFGC